MSGSSERKTQPTEADPRAFLAGVEDPRRRADAEAACELIAGVTGADPRMWGPSIVAFGETTYTGSDRLERPWFVVGLAPRKAALTFYGLTFYGSHADLLERLGPHTTGKGCLYVKRLAELDEAVLVELIERAWERHRGGATFNA
jgi:hypothetical protein